MQSALLDLLLQSPMNPLSCSIAFEVKGLLKNRINPGQVDNLLKGHTITHTFTFTHIDYLKSLINLKNMFGLWEDTREEHAKSTQKIPSQDSNWAFLL